MKLKHKGLIISFLGLIVATITMYFTYEALHKKTDSLSSERNSAGYISIGGDVSSSNIEGNELGSSSKHTRVDGSSISNNKAGYISIDGNVDKSKISNNILKSESASEKVSASKEPGKISSSFSALSTFGVPLEGADISINAGANQSSLDVNLTDVVNSKIDNNNNVNIKIQHPEREKYLYNVFDKEKFSMILGSCRYLYNLAKFLYPDKDEVFLHEVVESLEKRRYMHSNIEYTNSNGNIVNTQYCLNEKQFCEKINLKTKPIGKSFYTVTDIKVISNEECSQSSLDCSNISNYTLAYSDYSSFDSSLNGVPDASKKTNALHQAVKNGDLSLVKELLNKEVEVEFVPYFSNIPTTKKIYRYQANIDDRDESGATALEIAVWGGHLEIAKILVENKANIFVGKGDESWNLVNDANDFLTGIKPEIGEYLAESALKMKSLTCSDVQQQRYY